MLMTTVSVIVTTMRILMAVSVKSYSWMHNDNCEDCTLICLGDRNIDEGDSSDNSEHDSDGRDEHENDLDEDYENQNDNSEDEDNYHEDGLDEDEDDDHGEDQNEDDCDEDKGEDDDRDEDENDEIDGCNDDVANDDEATVERMYESDTEKNARTAIMNLVITIFLESSTTATCPTIPLLNCLLFFLV